MDSIKDEEFPVELRSMKKLEEQIR